MPQVLEDLAELPPGAHGLSFHSDSNEAQDHAVRFLSGAPKEAAASYWVATPEIAEQYNERLASDLPERVGCVASLGHEQVEDHEGRLRPVGEVTEFVREHPDGVTAAADTISLFWDLESVPEHLEYEEWFQEQPRDRSRFRAKSRCAGSAARAGGRPPRRCPSPRTCRAPRSPGSCRT
jgi:hypothetical protein